MSKVFKTQDNKETITNILDSNLDNYQGKSEPANLEGKTVLVVDDFENTLNVIKFTLEQANFQVLTAKSGQEALKLFQQDIQPDIIISDLNMPNMNGFELIENIRKIRDIEGIPTFILTTEYLHYLLRNSSNSQAILVISLARFATNASFAFF